MKVNIVRQYCLLNSQCSKTFQVVWHQLITWWRKREHILFERHRYWGRWITSKKRAIYNRSHDHFNITSEITKLISKITRPVVLIVQTNYWTISKIELNCQFSLNLVKNAYKVSHYHFEYPKFFVTLLCLFSHDENENSQERHLCGGGWRTYASRDTILNCEENSYFFARKTQIPEGDQIISFWWRMSAIEILHPYSCC